MEIVLWLAAFAVLAAGIARWRGAEPVPAAPPSALRTTPPPVERLPRERLATAASTVAGGNPFRLDRAPAPIPFPVPGADPSMMPGMPPPYEPPPPPRPELRVTGIVGPPWQALLEGVPGHDGAVVVRGGETFGELRVRSVGRETVVVAGADTTWRLSVRNPWQ